MELHFLQTLSLPSLEQDAVAVVGAGVALLAVFAFINLGVLLPGLPTALGGPQPDPRGEFLEIGPGDGPVISEPAPRRAASSDTKPDRHDIARPHLWRHLAGCAITPLAPPVLTHKR
ncbi:MAG: hypothetical protein ACRDJC_19430 [Thermomicrobiales bacterium]